MTMTTLDVQNAPINATQPGLGRGAESLGISEFLTLMSAQLRHQDPLQPMDGTQFVAQLAQFGTVSGVQQMQEAMQSLSTSLRSNQVFNGAALIGRQVMVEADHVQHQPGLSLQGEIDVPQGVGSLQLRISDQSGAVIREIDLPTTPGTATFQWDGLLADGQQAAAGRYDLQVIAEAGGQRGSLPLALAARVDSVSIDATGLGLTLNSQQFGALPLGDVRRVL